MHPFLIVGGLLHATALAVVGFFVLFAASKAGGVVRTIGNVLGVWLFVIAALATLGPRDSPEDRARQRRYWDEVVKQVQAQAQAQAAQAQAEALAQAQAQSGTDR